ncbi:MAG: LicD family protein [Treponema sp.]|nr:LicD family protein [Treponema sp.]
MTEYTKPVSIEELKAMQLEILKAIDDFCKKHLLSYSLCGGSLLGAIRHKGYIPWDDDIDIMMPRPDYEKFSSLFNENVSGNTNLKFITCDNDIQYFQPFGKVVDMRTFMTNSYDRPVDSLGVNIDIFPCDGLPNNDAERDLYWKRIAKAKNWNTLFYQKKNDKEKGCKKIIRRILFVFFRFLPANTYAKKLNKMAMKNDFDTSRYVACSVFGYGRKEEMPKSVFDSFVELDFEDEKFNAMQGYEIYLTNLYGNYMKVPPLEKQVPKHDFEVYWR